VIMQDWPDIMSFYSKVEVMWASELHKIFSCIHPREGV
jgi:hypothetical protein